jgi:hypothetical protein
MTMKIRNQESGKGNVNDATIPQNAIQVKDIHFPKGAVKSLTSFRLMERR